MKYPFTTTKDGSVYVINFPDVPEALSNAPKSKLDVTALDCLVTALAGYALSGKRWPKPSPIAPGQKYVQIPALLIAKLALIGALEQSGLTQAELGAKLRIDPRAVRRLLDLNHRSHIAEVERALEVLGKQLHVKAIAA